MATHTEVIKKKNSERNEKKRDKKKKRIKVLNSLKRKACLCVFAMHH